jgi:hypothetical protein
MISAKDLRIGNWYKNHSNTSPFAKIGYGHEIDYVAVYCDPIELTPDILVKCGFVEDDKWEYSKFDLRFTLKNGELIPDPYYTGQAVQVNVKSLHQLQNLIYALTNEELNIQL